MRALAAVGCGVLGLLMGLFVNVVIERGPEKRPLRPFRPPRPTDGEAPAAAGVAPFLVPAACGLLFAGVVLRFGADWVVPAYFVFFAALVAISVLDLKLQIIPNRVVYPAIFLSVPLLALAALAQHDWSRFGRALAGASLAWLALFLVHLIQPGGMGFGDVRLSFLLGLFLGWLSYGHVVTGLFLGFLLGAVIGLGLVLLRLRSRTDHVPFGPFLAAGAALAVFASNHLVHSWIR